MSKHAGCPGPGNEADECFCAGAVSKTATAPLEKIRLSMMTAGSKSSILDTVMRTWRSGGVLAFFNGNAAGACRSHSCRWEASETLVEMHHLSSPSLTLVTAAAPDVIRVMPSKAIEFTAFDTVSLLALTSLSSCCSAES